MTRAIMAAATGSGVGKTTFVCAALGALTRRGLRVRALKCGPDYIDPMFHRAILGVSSRNLDLVMSDEATARRLFRRDCGADVDAIVVESVMGLYDGLDFRSDEGSSYRAARALDLPIVLIVDAKGMGRSALAVVKGFQAMDVDRRIVGVVLNRVSESTFRRLRPIIETEARVKAFGYLPDMKDATLESRRLGLRTPNEVENLRALVRRWVDAFEQTVDVDALIAAARETPFSHLKEASVPAKSARGGDAREGARVRIAVARDDAFCFYYDDNLRMLREAGAELAPFSPLDDDALPENVDGLLLGGGYPELFVERLSRNRGMLESTRRAWRAGIPALAECGGFMYLGEAIVDRVGARFPMVGAIRGEFRDAGKLVRFGYVELEDKSGAFFGTPGDRIRGHEFHYYDGDDVGADCVATKLSTGRRFPAAHVNSRRWLGFAHLYYPSNPRFPELFVEKCRAFHKERRRG